MSIEINASDLEGILEFSKELAREAGKIILEGSRAIQILRGSSETDSTSGDGVSQKKNAVDLVTEWDVKVEEYVKSEIRKRYPGFGFIGEESYSAGDSAPTITDETPAFCVDPIDGTTNFIHGFPFACVSIGFIYKTQPTVGVIFNPFLNHMYSGLKSKGAYLNAIRLPVHPPGPLPSLANALIAVEWGSDRSLSIITKKADSFTRLAGDGRPGEVAGGKMAHSLRSLGSAALNYGMVASGSLDLYWEIGCWPWDVCAGIVIAQEAGCMVVGSRNSRDHDENVNEEFLWGRKYLVIRAIGDTAAESGRDAQRRVVKEFYETVEDWTPV